MSAQQEQLAVPRPPAAGRLGVDPHVTDDMTDTPAELARWPALAGSLRHCETGKGPAFRAADQAALAHQRTHRRLTQLAAVCGTVAVLAAIAQLAFPRLVARHVLEALEFIAAVAAAGAVVLGVASLRLTKWLLERH